MAALSSNFIQPAQDVILLSTIRVVVFHQLDLQNSSSWWLRLKEIYLLLHLLLATLVWTECKEKAECIELLSEEDVLQYFSRIVQIYSSPKVYDNKSAISLLLRGILMNPPLTSLSYTNLVSTTTQLHYTAFYLRWSRQYQEYGLLSLLPKSQPSKVSIFWQIQTAS